GSRAAAPGRCRGVRRESTARAGRTRHSSRHAASRRQSRAQRPATYAGHHLSRRRMSLNLDLFAPREPQTPLERLGPQAVVLHGYALARERALLTALQAVTAAAPFRHMITPGGYRMSVAMTNCGAL